MCVIYMLPDVLVLSAAANQLREFWPALASDDSGTSSHALLRVKASFLRDFS